MKITLLILISGLIIWEWYKIIITTKRIQFYEDLKRDRKWLYYLELCLSIATGLFILFFVLFIWKDLFIGGIMILGTLLSLSCYKFRYGIGDILLPVWSLVSIYILINLVRIYILN